MTILGFEIATRYGALDSTAVAKGGSVNAHVLRTIAMNGNRLAAKGQALFSKFWPGIDTTSDAGAVFGGFAPLRYTRVLPPIPCAVKPGLTRAEVRLTMRSRTLDVVHVQIVTRGRALTTSRVDVQLNSATLTDVDIDDVELEPDLAGMEEFSIYVRGVRQATLGDTSTYGSGNRGTFSGVLEDHLIDPGSAWRITGSGNPSWAEGGHIVAFEDSSGNEVAAPREIIGVTGEIPASPGSGTILQIAPGLSPAERTAILAAGGYFSIYELPRWDCTNFAAAAIARTS